MLPGNATAILGVLRLLMVNQTVVPQNLTAYIVPSGDAHHSEYTSPCDERRAFISGFDGSAGTAVVTGASALLWTDSRYHIQAENQIDKKEWTLMKQGESGVPSISAWLKLNLTAGDSVGVDPSLYSKTEWDSLQRELEPIGIQLVGVERNLVDLVWGDDKPKCSNATIRLHPLEFTGRNVSDKLDEVRRAMVSSGADILVLSELDEIAWLLNLRGSDIPYNPFFTSYLLINSTSLELFVEKNKTVDVVTELSKFNCKIYEYEDVAGRLLAHITEYPGKVWLSKNCNYLLVSKVPAARQVIKLSPVAGMKGVKNPVEAEGLILSHIRDGAAMADWLAWLEEQMDKGTANLTEISVATKLEEFRSKQKNFAGLSFDTISASGPNAALPHYSPKPSADRKLNKSEIYLVDSGGQYLDGTTDVTRTVYFAENPKQEMKDAFTRVLKGMISLRTAVFPKRSVGSVLDTLARKSLWDARLDYGHGTGHGVGSYLGVHEGPFSIGGRPGADDPGLDENMFTSDEPGYYKEGDFGIRIENVIRVVTDSKDKNYITFDDVTLVPIQKKLVDETLLTKQEMDYLNAYNEKIRSKVGDYMRKNNGTSLGITWLERETEPYAYPDCNSSVSLNLPSWTLLSTTILAFFKFVL